MKSLATSLLVPCVVGFSFQAAAQDIDGFTLSGEDAVAAKSSTEISVTTAEQIAKACVSWAEERGRRVSVVILGLGGNLVYAYRMDGHLPVNIETAQMKAETALYYRISSHAVLRRYSNSGNTPQMIKLNQYMVEGGLPIMVGDEMIGAVGVGGYYQHDEICAHHALTAVIGPQPPLVDGS